MAKFRFSMQNLLNIKEKLESQYQMEYGRVLQKRDENLLEIQRIKGLILKENQIFFEKQSQTFLVKDLIQVQNKIAYLKDLEKEALVYQKELEAKVIVSRERLAKAMQERKTYEILREKALEMYLEEEKRAELKVVDEQSSFKFSRK